MTRLVLFIDPMNCVPSRVCSGRLTGARRKSVVVVGPWTGSVGAQGTLRYSTMTRFGVPVDDDSNRTCVYDVFAANTPMLTPASRAASTLSRISFDQYSSWPEMRNPLRPSSAVPLTCVSMSVEYVTSYPDCSIHRMKLTSHLWKLPRPESA